MQCLNLRSYAQQAILVDRVLSAVPSLIERILMKFQSPTTVVVSKRRAQACSWHPEKLSQHFIYSFVSRANVSVLHQKKRFTTLCKYSK